MRIFEVSDNNIEGSFTKDLILSKTWLVNELSKIKNSFSTIYILGSWYGNTGILLRLKRIKFDKTINVDTDSKVLKKSLQLYKKFNLDKKLELMNVDANDLDYRQLDKNGLVINTSTTNMEDQGWFDSIPKGTLVALQGRDTDPKATNQFKNLDSFIKNYPLDIIYKGKIQVNDPETTYHRFMIIGYK